ncbi:VapE family protein [Maribacter sp. PR1]|uniref:VapE domain-containing protein n=1 Tax=Maribacter cobaltidurans TaxID=1178778 RepID=A0ABU7IPV2_9FLAO|nr:MULTISPECIES: VapE domain-containing protein [Maribacter]MDC6387538.1 VapE family protein [Maribacter sp. PR1]MEE1974925.1 VapE domain-containing protein [Maribacter cobaltidurans]
MQAKRTISYFEGFSKPKCEMDLSDILSGIKKGDFQKEILLEIRDRKKRDEDYSQLKRGLTGFTPCGTFKVSRKEGNLKEYSGLIVLDLDNLGIRKLPKIKQQAIHDPHTLAVFVSPSGAGLKILVQVDSDKDLHAVAFKQVAEYYESLLNLEVDKSGKDVSRLCFISYDPELFYNPNSKAFQIVDLIEEQFSKALVLTSKSNQFIEGQRNNFVYSLACNCNRLGIPIKAATKFIMGKYAYDRDEVLSTINSAYSRVLPPLKDSFKEADPIETYLSRKYDFRFNLVKGSVEYKEKGETCYSGLTDRTVNSFVRELKIEGLKIHKNKLVDLLESDFSPEFHPMVEYLTELPVWDGETDYIADLAKRVSTDDNEFFVDAFKRWFVAMVACAIYPDIVNQSALIFSGGQGIGKSTFIRNLLPKQLRHYQYSGMIEPKSKDSLIYLAECFIIDLDELSNLTRKSNNEMKEMITKGKVKVRRPYGKMSEDLPRSASFIGSVNEDQFLTDTTGNRRYLCFRVDKIDYTSPVNHQGVFSQAYKLLKSGFKYYFDQDDNKKLTARNEKFRQKSLLEDLIDNYKPADKINDADLYMNAGEFLNHLSDEFKVQIDDRNNVKLGILLSQRGYKKRKRGGRYVYAIDIKSNLDNDEQAVLKLSA